MPILQREAGGRDLPALWAFPVAEKEERREEFKGSSDGRKQRPIDFAGKLTMM